MADTLGEMYRAVAYLTILTIFFVFVLSAPQDGHYTTRFDSIDIDQILSNERIFKRYIDCLLDKGRCTPEARELKKLLPDALQTECKKCSAIQRKQGAKVIKFLIKNNLPAWNALLLKYDPQGIFRKKYNYQDESTIEDVLKRFAKEHP
ncbi:ejaculatory bulb-specific protein 3-like [Lycorma delicatula]|uniref:ejaculatory bulb-specific protein 3-like n=1 Tax=Lycorma delicatula TaxID=130591 RepID=UPI003F50F89B